MLAFPLAGLPLCKGDFALGYGKAAGGCLLRVRLVQFAMELLKGGRVEAVGKNGGKAADVRACFHFFHAAFLHFGLDEVFERFHHGFRFVKKGLPLLEFFHLGNDDALFTHDIVPSFRSSVSAVCLATLIEYTNIGAYSISEIYTNFGACLCAIYALESVHVM